MSDVFISHSSRDKEAADKVCGYLEERGLTCWIAPRDIVPGTDWAAAITTAITASRVFLIIYSANSAASDQVAREMSLAETKKNVYVVPYKIDNTELTGSFEYYLIGAHWITANYARQDYKLEELYNNIAGILGRNIQNITNNTYIDHLHIENGGDLNKSIQDAVRDQSISPASPPPPPQQPPEKTGSKKPIIIGAAALLAAAIAAGVIIAVSSGKKDDSSSSADEISSSSVSAAADSSAAAADTSSAAETADSSASEITASSSDEASSEASPSGSSEGLDNVLMSYRENLCKGTYEGETGVGGIPEGKGEFNGTYNDKDGEWKITCTGDFVNGKPEGQCTVKLEDANGSLYEIVCEFKDGAENGKGTKTITFKDDIEFASFRYEGSFKDGKFEDTNATGEYTYISSDENGRITRKYTGGYSDGHQSGEGTRVITYKTDTDFKDYTTYSKDWKDGVVNGTGKETINYRNGDVKVYEGEMKDGLWDGNGTLKHTNADGSYTVSKGTYEKGNSVSIEKVQYDKNGKEISKDKIEAQ